MRQAARDLLCQPCCSPCDYLSEYDKAVQREWGGGGSGKGCSTPVNSGSIAPTITIRVSSSSMPPNGSSKVTAWLTCTKPKALVISEVPGSAWAGSVLAAVTWLKVSERSQGWWNLGEGSGSRVHRPLDSFATCNGR